MSDQLYYEFRELIAVMGDALVIDTAGLMEGDIGIVREHLMDLDKIPKPLLGKLRAAGLHIHIGGGSVSDFAGLEWMADIQVSGRQVGTTWSEVAGAYVGREKRMVLGTWGILGERTKGIAPHEIGHALGDLLGYYPDGRLEQAY